MTDRTKQILLFAAAATPVIVALPLAAYEPTHMAKQPDPRDFIHVETGDLPLIISAPHGGEHQLPGVPERRGETRDARFKRRGDTYTRDIADGIAGEIFARTGRRPFVVEALAHRRFLDVNRPPGEAFEHPLAAQVYDAYHAALTSAITAVSRDFEHGLLIDIHGQRTRPADIYVGTKRGRTMPHLRSEHGRVAVQGAGSLGGLLALAGYTVPGYAPYATEIGVTPRRFTGGYIVRHYGAGSSFAVDAIQIEIHARRRENADERERVSRAIGKALVEFSARYLDQTATP